MGDLWKQKNYLLDIPYLIAHHIYEYDIQKANINVLRELNYIDDEYYNKACELIDEYDLILPMQDFDKEKFYDEMFLDKKAQGGKVRFVLPKRLYEVEITSDVTKEQVFGVL